MKIFINKKDLEIENLKEQYYIEFIGGDSNSNNNSNNTFLCDFSYKIKSESIELFGTVWERMDQLGLKDIKLSSRYSCQKIINYYLDNYVGYKETNFRIVKIKKYRK